MKKVYLLVFVFAFFSVIPSFGMKLITNNETNRIVPSRSGNFEAEKYIDTVYNNTYPSNENLSRRYPGGIPGYQGDRFEHIYRPVLEQDIRSELIGRTWNYPDYYYAHQLNDNNKPPEIEQKTNENIYREFNSKPYIREAADYYFIDTNHNSNEKIPIGIQ